MSLKERIVGCLLGGALGDAWGGPWEGATGPVAISIPECPRLSDDTQLTLATCESVIRQRHVDPEDIAAQFLRWYLAGQLRGLGSSTLKAMRDLAVGTHWALAGARGEYAAGNGAAMRIAPLAFLLDPADNASRTVIRDVCRITHHNDEAYVGALAVLLAIRCVLSGKWSEQRSFLAESVEELPDSAVADRIRELMPLRVPAPEVASRFGASGHVVDTVPLALYCAQSIATESLCAVLMKAIGCGGDTDTIASIAGQIAGTVVGSEGVPREFLSAVEDSPKVAAVAEQFASAVVPGNAPR